MSDSQKTQSEQDVTVFAKTTFRDEQVPFGIKRRDRLGHLYIIGKTGTGKSTLLETLITDDLRKGYGCALLDPHGDLVKDLYRKALDLRRDDLLYFDAPNQHQPFGFNPLANVTLEKRPLAASGILQVFRHLWQESWGPRLEHILRNCLLALLDYPNATLADVLPLLSDKKFRLQVARHLTNSQVKDFWLKEYENYPARLRAEAISPIQNKVGAFLSNPILKRILTEPQYPLKLRQVMDEGKVLLVNLAKGGLGEDTANLLGSLLISRFDLAALSRANVPEAERNPFYLYADEFHNFTTESLSQMLSENRKYGLALTLVQQYLSQVSQSIRDGIIGNVGTIISFRIGTTDAEILAPEFAPEIHSTDLLNLPNHHIYLKMMVDGVVTKPFSAVTVKSDNPPE